MPTLTWMPEMGQHKPAAQIEATLSHYGKHYYLVTDLELAGRGIKKTDTRQDGSKAYKVTIRAYETLERQYTISRESLLD